MTAVRLHLHLLFLKRIVDFHKLVPPPFNPLFLGIDPLDFDKLE